MEVVPQKEKWLVVRLIDKKTGNAFYDFCTKCDFSLLKEKYKIIQIASYDVYEDAIAHIKKLES